MPRSGCCDDRQLSALRRELPRPICAPRSAAMRSPDRRHDRGHDRGRRFRRRLRHRRADRRCAAGSCRRHQFRRRPPPRSADHTTASASSSDEAALVRRLRQPSARRRELPMLWIYAQNDQLSSGPSWRTGCIEAFTAGGGRAQLIDAPAIRHDDGHLLFGIAGQIDLDADGRRFPAREQKSGRARAAGRAPLPQALQPPPRLSEKAAPPLRTYLAAGPHKAFAVSPNGAFRLPRARNAIGHRH